jgi:hypothetical protein
MEENLALAVSSFPQELDLPLKETKGLFGCSRRGFSMRGEEFGAFA